MCSIIYVYQSPIGPIYIQYNSSTRMFMLIIKDICYGNYQSAVAAADDVYCHVTGCFDWDSLDCEVMDVPTDIYEWQRSQ